MSKKNLSAEQHAALAQFQAACDALRDANFNVVACASAYDDDAHFSTRLSLNADEQHGVTKDHIVLDAIREIMVEWHQINHDTDLVHLFRPVGDKR